jgi:predicted Zn-dependent protease
MRRTLIAGVVAVVAAVAGCGGDDENGSNAGGGGSTANDRSQSRLPSGGRASNRAPSRRVIRGSGVWLVPLDQSSRRLLVAASGVLKRRYGVKVSLLPGLRSEERHFNKERGQLDASELVGYLQNAYPKRAARAVVIGVTNMDVFSSLQPDWRFVFGLVHDDGYAVLATARMDPANAGRPADPVRLRERLTKMLNRYVGELYFQLPRNDNPRSVLRRSILGGDDLDAASDAFCPTRPAEVRSC